MEIFIGALAGIFLGSVIWGFSGFLAGLFIGMLFGMYFRLAKRLRKLELAAAPVPPVAATAEARAAPAPEEKEKEVEAEARQPVPAAAPPAPKIEVAAPVEAEAEIAAPAAPSPILGEKIVAAIRSYFLGGNTVVRVGVIVLFFGVAFLLNYAIERGYLSIELRLAGAALGGIVLLVLGWRLRHKREGYALALQGGGVGILYLTIFAALRLYHLLPATGAFALLVVVCAASAALAVLQSSISLALLGIAGGFLAPILTSTGGGSHVVLFSYYALLNAGILAIAWFKAWRPLNLVGFAFTFVIGTSWGMRYYKPEFFPTVEPFLILSVLFYVAIAILYSLRRPLELRDYVDGTLVFGTPIIAFGLQAALVHDTEYGLAYSAYGLGAFYLLVTFILIRLTRATMRMLSEAFLSLGMIFATMAIPLALDGRWSAAVWAVEGAGVFWIGIRQQRRLMAWFGMALQLGAGWLFAMDLLHYEARWPVLNSFYFGTLLLAAAAGFIAYQMHRRPDAAGEQVQELGVVFLVWAVGWWLFGGVMELHQHVHLIVNRVVAGIVFLAFSAALFETVGSRLAWPLLRAFCLGLLPLLYFSLLVQAVITNHAFAHNGWLAWGLALATWYAVLYRRDRAQLVPSSNYWHAVALWLLGILATWEINWGVGRWVQGGADWKIVAWGLVPTAFLALATHGARFLAWPLRAKRAAYLTAGAIPFALTVLIWTVAASLERAGAPAPLPYVPVLNPLDLTTALALLAVVTWLMALRAQAVPAYLASRDAARWTVAAVVFVWMNAMLFRSLHHYAGIPYGFQDMYDSVLAQAAVSLFWTVIGLVLMVFATRHGQRMVWITGATLLGVVVAKLFLVDLSNTGTVARIVTFIGVGALLLLVGYLSPVPPRHGRDKGDEKQAGETT